MGSHGLVRPVERQHRHAVPRLVLLAVALATSWSASAVAWVAVLAHIGCWLSVVWLMRDELDDWALVALSLVWFSPQYESFVWGWALHGGLTLLFSVLAIVAVEARRDRVRRAAGDGVLCTGLVLHRAWSW